MAKEHLKKPLIEALKKHLGIVSTACEVVGLPRKTYYEWLKSDDEFRREVDDLKEVALDFAESKLLESIENGSDTATIFYLKTKGKSRGYIERSELDHKSTDGSFKAPVINVLNVPTDEA